MKELFKWFGIGKDKNKVQSLTNASPDLDKNSDKDGENPEEKEKEDEKDKEEEKDKEVAERRRKAERSKRQRDAVILVQASIAENLNISGIRYVIGHTSLIRRLMWTAALLGMTSWLIVNLVIRISDYLSTPRSIDTKVTFKQEMKFPAILLCNYNTFR